MYIADYNNHRIRKVTVSTGIITTVVGTGINSYSGDNGQATSATLSNPYGLALDIAGYSFFYYLLSSFNYVVVALIGNVYIADQSNNRIRKVTMSSGIITTVAGSGGFGYSGDNIAATSALLYSPQGVAVDVSGNVYIADTFNNRMRKVTISTPTIIPTYLPSSGIITTIAGTGSTSYSGDNGASTSAGIYNPYGVALDASGRPRHSIY